MAKRTPVPPTQTFVRRPQPNNVGSILNALLDLLNPQYVGKDVELPNTSGETDPRLLERLFGSSFEYRVPGDNRHIDTPPGLEFERNEPLDGPVRRRPLR